VKSVIKNHFDGDGGIRMLLVIAVPMIVSSAAETIMMFVDRLFLSRLSPIHLAAGLSGGLTAFMMSTFFQGTIGYVNALVAQRFGAKQPHACGRAAAQGLILAVLSYPLVLILVPLISLMLRSVGHDPVQVGLELDYFRIIAFGSIFGLLRTALAGFFCGIGRTKMVMVANLVALIINVPANAILIFGKFGCPALGIKGAAYGTIIGSAVALVILLFAYWAPAMRDAFGTATKAGLDKPLMKLLLKFGIPSGVEFFLNVAAFNVFVTVFQSYGTTAAAAISITLNWDLLALLPLMGMGQAVTSLTGRYIGAGQPDTVRRATFSGIKSCFLYGVFMSALFVFAPGMLVDVFAQGEAYASVRPMAIMMLKLAAIYTMADGLLVVFDGALRGVGDTRWIMRVSAGLHWLMALASIILIRVLHVSPVMAWVALIVFVLIITVVLGKRFLGEAWRTLDVLAPASTPINVIEGAASGVPPDIK
jgi:MATE family multidrug resistance protein